MTMATIYRYQIPLTDECTIQMPGIATILSAEVKPGESVISVWAVVYPESGTLPYRFRVIGTGHPIDPQLHRWRFLNTVILAEGRLCFHVFCEKF